MTDIDRRGFLSMCALSVAALGVTSVVTPTAAEAATGIKRLPNGKVQVTVRKFAALATVGKAVKIGNVKGVPVAVVRTGRSTFIALNLRCTHEGVTVTPTSTGFTCAAHGSKFGKNGARTRGPASSALRRVPVTLASGVLTVG